MCYSLFGLNPNKLLPILACGYGLNPNKLLPILACGYGLNPSKLLPILACGCGLNPNKLLPILASGCGLLHFLQTVTSACIFKYVYAILMIKTNKMRYFSSLF
jgi:hypothetical protein